MKLKILVLCTGNSCRSQIAEAYLQYFANEKAEIYSAGVETHGVNPKAITIMLEDGINISNHTSNHIDEYAAIDFDGLRIEPKKSFGTALSLASPSVPATICAYAVLATLVFWNWPLILQAVAVIRTN